MTLKELESSNKLFISPREMSQALNVPYYGIILAAKKGKLNLPFYFSGNRLKISRQAVLALAHGEIPLHKPNNDDTIVLSVSEEKQLACEP